MRWIVQTSLRYRYLVIFLAAVLMIVGIARLKEGEGGPLLVAGSRTLVRTLIERDLVDEFRLMIFPLVLGSGFRMFPESERKLALRLADSQAFKSGVVLQVYRR